MLNPKGHDVSALVREGIKSILSNFDDLDVTLEAANGKELIDKLNSIHLFPEILLIDISMPVMNGFETMLYLKNYYPNLSCIALSVNIDNYSIFTMIKSGAKAYLAKDCDTQQLYNTIIAVKSKGDCYDSFVIESLVNFNLDVLNTRADEIETIKNANISFSPNELQFIKLNCSELTFSEIADIMNLSPRTIEGYRDSVFKKIKIKSRQGLILYAIKNGIYDLK